jgi:chromosome partitioning protein
VDCPGFGSQVTVFAIGTADLVLIPSMTDEANVFEALRMRRIVESASRLTRRKIPSRTLLTRVKRAGVAEHSHRQLIALEAEPLESRLSDRSIFQEATFHGSSPVILEPSGAAAREVAGLARELESLEWWAGIPVPAEPVPLPQKA